jgi:hypothetical protein
MIAWSIYRRNCLPTKPCEYLTEGCASDDDCETGLACGTINGTTSCQDKDECAEDPDICGEGKVCQNIFETYKYEILDNCLTPNIIFQIFRCILPDEQRVALVIGGLRMTDNKPLMSIEVYNTFNVKGEAF